MRKFLVATAVASMAVALTACSGGGSSGSGSASGSSQALSIAAIGPIESFVPGNFGVGPATLFAQPVYDSLLRNDNNGEPVANVATDWSYDSAHTTLSMTLRNDVTFTDGAKLDAAAVKANLEAAKKGTGESGGELHFLDHVVVVDPTHVKVVLSAPDPSFVANLGGNAGMLASPKALGSDALKTTPVGSGPYVYDQGQSQTGTKYVYTRNDKYWNKKLYPYSKITVTVFNDSNAILNALRAGQVDFAQVENKDVASLKSAGLTTASFPAYTTSGLYLFDRAGKSVPALGDVRVRQAINYAMDRAAIKKQVWGGEGTPTTQLFSAESPAYEKSLDDKYSYDVAKAKQLMSEAGYAKGFKLTMPDVSPVYPAQQAATTEALKAIGITPDYQPVNGQTFISDLIGGKYPAAIFGLSTQRPWDTAQTALAPGGIWNTFHVSDPTVVSLIAQAQKQTGAEQDATFKKLNEYIVDQAWFANVIQSNNDFAMAKDVKVSAQKYSTVPPIWNFSPAS